MFHIIMPVYNAQEFLKDAIESITEQSLSFEENVILHLIDDASKDESLSICKEYEEKYPKNIVVTHFEENKGVSAVRNFGLKQSRKDRKGIVGFVDSDDCLETHALEKVDVFFKQHKEIQMACMEIEFFGAREGAHKSNWRFEEREVVNIADDYNFPQYYIGGVFLKGKAAKKLKFDETMNFWEDAFAINQVLLKIKKYGLVKGAVYYYRQTNAGTSLVDQSWKNKNRYTTLLEQGYQRLMNKSKDWRGRISPYIQYVIAYHLRLFLLENNRDMVMEMIPKEELPAFKKRLGDILKQIDYHMIAELNTSMPVIEELLSLKYDKQIWAKRTYQDGDLIFSFGDVELARLSERNVRIIGKAEKPEYEGMIRGRFTSPLYAMRENDYIYAIIDGERIQTVKHPCKKKIDILDVRRRNYKHAGFALKVPKDFQTIQFGVHTEYGDVLLKGEIIDEELLRSE